MLAFYYSFGEPEGMVLAEIPNNISGLTTTIAAFSEGNLANIKTTILITVEEAMEAVKKASGVKLAQTKGMNKNLFQTTKRKKNETD